MKATHKQIQELGRLAMLLHSLRLDTSGEEERIIEQEREAVRELSALNLILLRQVEAKS
jgi:hypothetical protein